MFQFDFLQRKTRANGHAEASPVAEPNGAGEMPVAGEQLAFEDINELPINDLNAARFANSTLKTMRAGTVDRLKAISEAGRHLDPVTQSDAIEYISDVAIHNLGMDPDAVQHALAHGARLREQDRANGIYLDVRPKARAPLPYLDMSRWDSEEKPKRLWSIHNRAPLNQAGLFTGEGGTGKSLVEMYKDVAHVLGKDWYGSTPEKGPAFYIGAEDPENEIHLRLAAIAEHCGAKFADLIAGGLHVLPLLGRDAVLCTVMGKSGRVVTTELYKQLYEAAGDIKPKNISVDTLSRAFAGNELDRVEVYGFAHHMQALAMVASGSTTILAHPSLHGINSGTGLSGSTAWHGAFRFRQYLHGLKAEGDEPPDRDIRELEFKKNQYGPTDETILLRYDVGKGMFLPVRSASGPRKSQASSEAEAEDVFLRCLDELAKQGRRVGEKPGTNFAPAIMAKTTLGKAVGKRALAAAMPRLFDKGEIRIGLNPDVRASKAT